MSKGNKIVIGLLLFIIIGSAVILILNDKGIIELCKSCKCEPNCPICEEVKNDTNDKSEYEQKLLAELQKKYEEIYTYVAEGYEVVDKNVVINNLQGLDIYAWNFDKLKKYFSDNCIEYIKNHLSEAKYIDDKLYYFSDDEMMKSIFGQTDQDIRTLKLVSYTDDSALLISEIGKLCNPDTNLCIGDEYGDEYIMFKKINNVWYVDFFE